MQPSDDIPQIPEEFVDYRKRLIAYSEAGERQHFALLQKNLEEFHASETVLRFFIGDIPVEVYYLPDERFAVSAVIAELQPRFPELTLEPDVRLVILQQPNDPFYPRQWALRQIGAHLAWPRVQAAGRPDVTVAIVDSGIQINHQDLDPARINSVSVIAGALRDDTGHGTMLAGTIAALVNNNTGIAGEAQNVRILAVKFTDARTPPSVLAAVLGILTAVAGGASIINASWHVLEDAGLLRLSILLAGALNRLVVTAAGNDGSNNARIPTWPANYQLDNMISVMASDEHDDKAWFSNYGPDVDLAAPGVRVLSTGLYYANPAYRGYSGTSPAAAFVSGAAALLLGIDNWTPREIREHLVASVRYVRSLRGLCRAEGRLDLQRAILGPFVVLSPTGGELLLQGSLYDVQWQREYLAPVVNTVRIEFRNQANNVLLGQVGGLPNNGHRQVIVPNQAVPQAFVRVQCEQRNLFADSRPFGIV